MLSTSVVLLLHSLSPCLSLPVSLAFLLLVMAFRRASSAPQPHRDSTGRSHKQRKPRNMTNRAMLWKEERRDIHKEMNKGSPLPPAVSVAAGGRRPQNRTSPAQSANREKERGRLRTLIGSPLTLWPAQQRPKRGSEAFFHGRLPIVVFPLTTLKPCDVSTCIAR